ncbi:MAG: hypothetical protein ACXU7H_08895, partial [Burkholderiaceae bacterium]
VYLGDRWHTFDARNNMPRIGRVLIARGRDACDVALSCTFGPNKLTSFTVWTDEVTEDPALWKVERARPAPAHRINNPWPVDVVSRKDKACVNQ